MLMKNQKLCKQCLFGWYPSGNTNSIAYCEYQLITEKKRVNTEKSCSCYIKRERAGVMTDSQKMSIYNSLVRRGKAT